jgi:hypothetical protein
MSATTNLPTLSLEAAKIASDAAQEKAKELGIGTLYQSSNLTTLHKSFLTRNKTQTQTPPTITHFETIISNPTAHLTSQIST